MYTSWTCPLPAGGTSDEIALTFDQGRSNRLLVIPALFDEANKMRRHTVEVMRRLDHSGIDSFLPDLPGWNDSLAPLQNQTLDGWRAGIAAAMEEFQPSHVLTIRAGALLAPDGLPGWRHAPTGGKQALRAMLRARTIAAKEAEREETMDSLQALGRSEGIELAGWQLGAEMFAALEEATPPESEVQAEVAQSLLGGGGLWLRAEPDEDPEQADAMAAIIAIALLGGDA
ncbi:MAG: hypothetical protein H6918_06725 [Sphingomonadaceae bacterium]|nr:hypothetical protein [Sphingomonadaceae bacterium]